MTNKTLSDIANNIAKKKRLELQKEVESRPIETQEEKNRKEVQELARQLVLLRREKSIHNKKFEIRDEKIKDRLTEICGDEQGIFYSCISRQNERIYLWLRKDCDLPENLPECVGVKKYKTWKPFSQKRIKKIENQAKEDSKKV